MSLRPPSFLFPLPPCLPIHNTIPFYDSILLNAFIVAKAFIVFPRMSETTRASDFQAFPKLSQKILSLMTESGKTFFVFTRKLETTSRLRFGCFSFRTTWSFYMHFLCVKRNNSVAEQGDMWLVWHSCGGSFMFFVNFTEVFVCMI